MVQVGVTHGDGGALSWAVFVAAVGFKDGFADGQCRLGAAAAFMA